MTINKKFIIHNINELDEVANFIIKISKNSKIFYLTGDLGSGKTTLVQKICKILGSKDTVVSPSFALVNIYDSKVGDIYHIDLYRLNDIEEIINLGIEDYLYNSNYCFVEWPQLLKNISPELYYEININIIDNNSRKIEILLKEN